MIYFKKYGDFMDYIETLPCNNYQALKYENVVDEDL